LHKNTPLLFFNTKYIEDKANIKKFIIDRENKRIVLKSESTQNYLPIFIHEDDQYQISGRVVDVIKK